MMDRTPGQPMRDIYDHRNAVRRKVLRPGRIVINRRSAISCTVRNLSGRGAKLEVVSVVGIPDVFELEMEGRLQPCRVVWRRLKELGVAFIPGERAYRPFSTRPAR